MQSRLARLEMLLLVVASGFLVPVHAVIAADLGQATRIYEAVLPSVVRIEARYGASIFAPPGAGSGVVIGKDLIATADHVVQAASEIWVVGTPKGRQQARVIRRLPHQDLALIRTSDADPGRPLSLRSAAALRPGECVFAIGNVMNWTVGIFHGIVTATYCVDCEAGAADRILTDITTPPGLSGGALVDCATGSLVGIVSFGIVDLSSRAPQAGIIGAVPVSYVTKLLNEEVACGSVRQQLC